MRAHICKCHGGCFTMSSGDLGSVTACDLVPGGGGNHPGTRKL